MSDQLLRAIKKVQSDIKQYPDAFQLEEQTIRSLIDPILNALGWRVTEVNRVRQQYRIGRGKVDMALMRDGKPAVLVEAKALGTSLDEAVTEQVSQYCYREGAATGLLTNGREWHAYRPLLMDLTFEQRKLFSLNLEEDDVRKIVDRLALLGYENVDSLEKEDLNILLDAYWSGHARGDLLNAFAATLRDFLINWSGKSPGEVPTGKVKTWLRGKMFSDQRPAPPSPGPGPATPPAPRSETAVIIDGERMAVARMTEALQCVANWLVHRGHIGHDECPIFITNSSERYFIHTQPNHASGNRFRSPQRLANGLFLEAHAGNPQNMKYAWRLLERYGYRGEILQFRGLGE